MKLTKINIQNFIGARAVDVQLTTPITLFAGRNGSGKSSVQEAVRMALTGETVRVALKKDYGKLVTEGATAGLVEVGVTGPADKMRGGNGRCFVALPSGKSTPLTEWVPPTALPYVLDAPGFAALEANGRRAFLFGLMGIKTDGSEVTKRLLARGCNPERVETIAPMLRAGFDAACKEAQTRAREQKAAWRAVTGETWGDKKAETWAAPKPDFDAAALADLQKRLAATDDGLAVANQRLGALQADARRHAQAAQRLADLREQGSRYARIADKLQRDQAELKEWEAKVAALKDSANSQNATPCPDCAVMLVLKDGVLIHAASLAKGTEDDLARLPEYENAMHLMQRAVANGKRDLAEADAAAKAIAELEAAIVEAPGDSEIQSAHSALADLAKKQQVQSVSIDQLSDARRQAERADQITAMAQQAHQSVQAWSAIADALAPDGIPGQMLAEALGPVNERLMQSAADSGWERVCITSDMRVTMGLREYAMLSESEKWRADAMIAEAIAHLSGIKLLVLDRFDVLDLEGRSDLLYWLDGLALKGEIDTALIFGTLKALPASLPQTMAAHWLDHGETGKIKEVA